MTKKLYSSIPTPLTPPKLEEDRLSWLRLFRSRRVGVATFHRLIKEHGTAAAALEALPDIARAAGVDEYRPCSVDAARAEMKAARRTGARLLCFGDPDYPALLAAIEDPPPLLWCSGRTELLHSPMIALVGARNASSLGERMARLLAGALGEAGFTLVSGMARGIDTAAHGATLKTGTVAALAGGVDIAYPRENAGLFREIGQQGLRLSEQAPGLEPQARHFPPRNRIIAGLAHGLVVVEAAARSGSLITARAALDQGREVMAVPGHPFDPRAAGCNMLIRDGARLVRALDDILEAIGPLEMPPRQVASNWRDQARKHAAALAAPDAARAAAGGAGAPPANGRHPPGPVPRGDAAQMLPLHQEILSRIGPSPVPEDQLIRDLGIAAADLSPVLLSLELDGRICRQSGGLVSLSG
ncbi:DNA-processing protein DprA [Mangrovicoccus algicola]|uniref:DNA-protecting protein DprA n=1 Tax=Mangrovicoccus algicola TaxID=2771008 RepID=A0A8J6YXM2_9RHOB|nr:DNA-processing protein DprA [Mangrovicoccus algicola]MBE3637791.1 DNA-protecting protein DprA [Mangrovicoccus algicola]